MEEMRIPLHGENRPHSQGSRSPSQRGCIIKIHYPACVPQDTPGTGRRQQSVSEDNVTQATLASPSPTSKGAVIVQIKHDGPECSPHKYADKHAKLTAKPVRMGLTRSSSHGPKCVGSQYRNSIASKSVEILHCSDSDTYLLIVARFSPRALRPDIPH